MVSGPKPPVAVGDVITVGETDYAYGVGTVTVRITAIEGVQEVDGLWLAMRGHTVYANWQDDRERFISVRLSALATAKRN